jgi:hypothetical protein
MYCHKKRASSFKSLRHQARKKTCLQFLQKLRLLLLLQKIKFNINDLQIIFKGCATYKYVGIITILGGLLDCLAKYMTYSKDARVIHPYASKFRNLFEFVLNYLQFGAVY